VVHNLLVTGGAGFIGANFVHYWLERHPGGRLVVLDALTYAGNLASLASVRARPELVFVHGDVATPGLAEQLLRDHDITLIVHLAAESHVDRSIAGPDAFVTTNVAGTHELLKAARRVWLTERRVAAATRFHHVSTDEVYGSLASGEPPFTERAAYVPSSPYAASKAAGDHLVRAYHHTYGLPVTITNCSNNYGPFQFPEKLIPLMLVSALGGEPLPVYGDGLQVRDWLYVEDHCRAVEQVALRGTDGETYNVGGCNEWTNIAIVRLLCRLVDEAFAAEPDLARRFPDCPSASGRSAATLITFVADRPGHDRRYAIDAGKIQRELGFRPAQDFERGIRRCVTWYLANEPWWRQVMDGSYREWVARWYGRGADPVSTA
jgi:dTDP-glucose 4,6-dehydratase